MTLWFFHRYCVDTKFRIMEWSTHWSYIVHISTFSQICHHYITEKYVQIYKNVILMYETTKSKSVVWHKRHIVPVSVTQINGLTCYERQRILRNIRMLHVYPNCGLSLIKMCVHSPIRRYSNLNAKGEHYISCYKNKNVFWSKVALTQHCLN